MIRYYIYVLLCNSYDKVITFADFTKFKELIELLMPEKSLVKLLEDTVTPEVIVNKSEAELLQEMITIAGSIWVDNVIISLCIKEGTNEKQWLPLYNAVFDNLDELESSRNDLLKNFVCSVDTDLANLPF